MLVMGQIVTIIKSLTEIYSARLFISKKGTLFY